MAEDLPIVDAHHHLWDLETNHYPWLSGGTSSGSAFAPIARTYSLEDYLRDAAPAGIIRSVHVEAGFDPANPVAESRWLQSLSDEHGFPHAIIAHARPHEPDFEHVLAAHCQFPAVRGIRHRINWHRDPAKSVASENFLSNSRWTTNYPLLEKYGFSFELQVFPGQMEEAARLIERYPGIPVMIAHAGHPIDREPEMIDLWRKGITRLARVPHACIKISGLGMYDRNWTVDSIRPFVLHCIDAFGTDRAMFASNFPVDGLYSSFGAIWDAFKAITSEFSIDEKRNLFALNAVRFYRI